MTRSVISILMMLAILAPAILLADETVFLPEARTNKIPILKTIKARGSQRAFTKQKLTHQTLAEILWSAYGINRPESGKRTAPSSNNKQEIDIYAVMKKGTFLYNAHKHSLIKVSDKDLRALTGKQEFPAHAQLNIVYVLDYSRTPTSPRKRAKEVGAVAVGAIAQNVYLYCAAEGLGTVFRGWIDKEALAKAMNLGEHQYIVGAQSVGYPAQP